MKIRFALIPLVELARIQPLVDALRTAVNAGDMDGIDKSTAELATLTAGAQAAELSEEEWRRFLGEIRGKNPAFQSDYLLPSEVCSSLFAKAVPGAMVLQLPLDDKEGDDV